MAPMAARGNSFHLEWNNHLGNMQSVLETLYDQQNLVDVTVACRDGVLKAHKVILSACSPYFEAVFRETPCKHPVLILKGIHVREMQALLRFMYCGQVDVPEAELSALVATACEFKVKGFAMDCVPGIDDYQPESVSDHESEGDSNSQSLKGGIQKPNPKKCESSAGSLNEEVDMTPVIVGSQSLRNTSLEEHPGVKEEKGQEEEGEEEANTKDRKPEVTETTLTKESEEEEKPSIDGATEKNNVSGTNPSGKVSSGSKNNCGVASSNDETNNCSSNGKETTPYQRETRYKGRKRVDVGIRPPVGRPRVSDKQECSAVSKISSGSGSSQSAKKSRVRSPVCKSQESEVNQPREQVHGKIIVGSPEIDISISRAGCVGDGLQPFVKIKTEAESADEEEDEDEATADMFCIPHLQELPDSDGVDSSPPGEALALKPPKWAVIPQPLSGREQRSISEAPHEEGEGDMACPYCFTRCPRFSDLKRHMRLHTEDKPHECEFCSLAFARASHLARHRRTHTGERPFRCPVPSCERQFSRQDKLKLHTQRAHPGLPCEMVQSGTFMRIRGRRRIKDKSAPLARRVANAASKRAPIVPSCASVTQTPSSSVVSLPFGDTSYLTSLSLGQQRYSDLTISPVAAPTASSGTGASNNGTFPSGAGAEELLKSVRQLGECTIQTLPSKVVAE